MLLFSSPNDIEHTKKKIQNKLGENVTVGLDAGCLLYPPIHTTSLSWQTRQFDKRLTPPPQGAPQILKSEALKVTCGL